MKSSSHNQRRAGFTLVELMMVIAIIAFLIGITWVALANVLSGTKVKATQATIRKIDGLLSKRLEALEREFERRGFRSTSSTGVEDRKEQFMLFFPQTFAEAGITLSNQAAASHSPQTESAEVLYYFLTQTEALDTDDLDSDNFSSTEVIDSDGDGYPEFVDAWGEPLRFYRWPTRLVRPSPDPKQVQEVIRPNPMDPSTWHYRIQIDPDFVFLDLAGNDTGGASLRSLIPSISAYSGNRYPTDASNNPRPRTLPEESDDPLAQDADDPLGHWSLPGNPGLYETNVHTPATWSLPLIVSAGLDRELGLFEPYDKDNHGHLAQPVPAGLEALLDNITNRNIQAGGQ